MAAARHRSRIRALQVLFNWDVRRESVDSAISHYYLTLHSDDPNADSETAPLKPDPFMEELVRGTIESLSGIDKELESKAKNWRIERMPAVDRNILRLAIFELHQNNLPSPVIIDEALDLAKQFSSDESLPFINGVLDALSKSNFGMPSLPNAKS